MSWEPVRVSGKTAALGIVLLMIGLTIISQLPDMRALPFGAILILIGAAMIAAWPASAYERAQQERISRAQQERISTETTVEEQIESTAEEQPVAKIKCEYCGEDIPVANARFCWSCGASLPAGSEDEALIRAGKEEATQPTGRRSQKRARRCMICNLTLKPTDLTVWCPHCGNAFHRNHMLEWIHVKNSCPTCGKDLDEPDLAHGPPKPNQRRKR